VGQNLVEDCFSADLPVRVTTEEVGSCVVSSGHPATTISKEITQITVALAILVVFPDIRLSLLFLIQRQKCTNPDGKPFEVQDFPSHSSTKRALCGAYPKDISWSAVLCE
jgi:hypothetical protein